MEDYAHSRRLGQKQNFSFTRFFSGIILIIFLFLVARSIGQLFFKNLTHDDSSTLGKKTTVFSLSDLEKQVKDVLSAQKGSWSVYLVDYQTNKRIGINEQVIHRAASVNKLYVLASLYYLAGKGQIDLDETITLQARDIQDFGTGIIRYDSPGTVYSLKTLARLLIEKSDNTAEHLLRARIGDEEIQSIIEQFGTKQTSILDNKTSLSDLAMLFEKIKNAEITTKPFTAEMLDFLDESDFEDRLPALLPKDVRVHHKIGNEIGNIHDVGLIEKDDTTYFLGVLSSDIGDTEENAKAAIAQISKLVYDFEVK